METISVVRRVIHHYDRLVKDVTKSHRNKAACDDEAVHDDEEGGTSIVRRSPGRTLWAYEIGGGDEMDDQSDDAISVPKAVKAGDNARS
ncbi:hypothetical protein E4U31_008002 [Claviceps sp. LM219 group G6]|nr:hypothetical protein E4U14_006852 [Claviceps sp. LM454 group G7]KAG6107956.1 hypothetical protein E4U31_008002 [Claviceps sp. LM219 group G6]